MSIVASFVDPTEAQVAAGALRSAGFHADVLDQNFSTIDWTARQALGGIRVGVPDGELAEAADFLRGARQAQQAINDEEDEGDGEEPQPAASTGWRTVAVILGAALPLFALTVIRPQHGWQVAVLIAAGVASPIAWLIVGAVKRRGRESQLVPILGVAIAFVVVTLAISFIGPLIDALRRLIYPAS